MRMGLIYYVLLAITLVRLVGTVSVVSHVMPLEWFLLDFVYVLIDFTMMESIKIAILVQLVVLFAVKYLLIAPLASLNEL